MMFTELKDYICELLSQLSSEERVEIAAYLDDMELSSVTFNEVAEKIKEKRFNSGFFCPHCSSKKVVRYGYWWRSPAFLL